MKRGLLFFAVLTMCNVTPVYSAAGDQYLLPKFGIMSIDLNDADPLISYGVMWGFGLSDNFSFEAEYNSGLSGGEYVDETQVSIIIEGDYRVTTAAAYLVYRHPMANSNYIKTKFGILNEEVERSKTDDALPNVTENIVSDDVGIAGGIGFGSSIGKRLTLEFEITLIDKDIIFYSLGTHYRF
jgi:long-subunit fatty acid transport protein